MSTSKKLLVIGKVWPEPKSSAAGARILQIISIFKEKGYSITFSSAAKKNELSANFDQIGINEQSIELNNSSFNEFLKELTPDIVLFDRYMTEEQFGWRVSETVPDAIRILDTEDLHFLREARELCLKNGEDALEGFVGYLKNGIMVRELASILRCDISILISRFEMELLLNEFNLPESKLLYLPLLFDEEVFQENIMSPSFEERKHFVTIGNFLHPPNWDSVLFLKEYIWPKIRKVLSDAELHIYGAYTDQKALNLHNRKEGFLIKGRVDNVNQTLSNYRVMLAPLRFGAGQKGKLLDAMLSGLPSVTTSIGAEGMINEEVWPGFISNSKDQIVEKAKQLYLMKEEAGCLIIICDI